MPSLPSRRHGWIFGVCGGLQRATGMNAMIFRASFLVGAYFYTVSTLLLFALLFVVMRSRRNTAPGPEAEALPALDSGVALHAEIRALQWRLAQFEAEALSKDSLTARRFKEAGL